MTCCHFKYRNTGDILTHDCKYNINGGHHSVSMNSIGNSQKSKTKVINVAREADNPINQSELEAHTCSWHKAKENA